MVLRRPIVRLATVVLLAAIVVVGAIVVSHGGGGNDKTPPASNQAAEVQQLYAGIPQKGIHLGRANAPATLIEFADLQCPFCRQYSTTALPSIVRDYVRAGRVRYELRIRAFLGADSLRAAGAAAYAATQNRMYQFVDLFYRNQGQENSGYVTDAFIRRIASLVSGLDPDKTVAASQHPLDYPTVREAELLARRLGSTGTPDFWVRRGNRFTQLNVQGTSPQDYERALDAALGR